MTQFLVFRVYGPMVSWGDIAVGERRPTADRPSRSAVIGLLAGALGIDRDDVQRQAALGHEVGMASRVDVPGRLLHDYHTAQAPTESWCKDQRKRWKSDPAPEGPLWTRAEELSSPRHDLSTILSERAYLTDTLAAVAVWLRTEDGAFLLTDVEAALRRPVFMPYLGRKSCPPALPFAPHLVEADHPVRALQQLDFAAKESAVLAPFLRERTWPQQVLRTADEQKRPTFRQFAWQDVWPEMAGLTPTMRVERRDEPGRRRAWQFHTRMEQVAHEAVPKEVTGG